MGCVKPSIRAGHSVLCPYEEKPSAGSAYVECGGLPPLYAVPGCQDVLQDPANRGARRLLEESVRMGVSLGLGEASFAQKQRRQAAALHIAGAVRRLGFRRECST
jgi:hypothetical protein